LRAASSPGRAPSTPPDRQAATAAALGVSDALASASVPGAPTRVTGLRGGVALVARRGTTRPPPPRGRRFVRDGALDGIVTHDGKTGSVYAAVTLRGSDGS